MINAEEDKIFKTYDSDKPFNGAYSKSIEFGNTGISTCEIPPYVNNYFDNIVKKTPLPLPKKPNKYLKEIYNLLLRLKNYEDRHPLTLEKRDFMIRLSNAECRITFNLLMKLLDRSKLFKESKKSSIMDMEDVEDDDILFIKCLCLTSEYHFITAVVYNNRKKVDIYQSYGNSKPLYKRTLSYDLFLECLKFLHTHHKISKENYNKLNKYEHILYGINTNDELIRFARLNTSDSDEDEDDSDEDEPDALKFKDIEFLKNMNKNIKSYVINDIIKSWKNRETFIDSIEKSTFIVKYKLADKLKTKKTKKTRKTRKIK